MARRIRGFRLISMAAAMAAVTVTVGVSGTSGVQARSSVRFGVSKLSPRHGSSRGGTRVAVIGHGFTHVKSVTFGSSRAHIVRVVSPTKVIVTTARHAVGTVKVRVHTAGGVSAAAKADRYHFLRSPARISVGNDFGLTFACARNATWTRCWGAERDGELGNGTTSDVELPPVNVKGLGAGVRDISAGDNYACAVTAAGAAKCWGSESAGVLGNGVVDSNGFVSTPVTVDGLGSGVRSITAGGPSVSNTCAVTTVGVVECWGNSGAGLLGTNGPTDGLPSAVPVTIAGLPKAKSVAIMSNNAICALTTTGAVFCWGGNLQGQLGAGLGPVISATPVQVKGLSAGVRSLSAGGVSGGTACAVTAGGAVRCWGWNGDGVLGDGQTFPFQNFSNVPVAVKTLHSGQESVAVGPDDTACAVSTTGRAKCWGSEGGNGMLGDGNVNGNPSAVPVQVKGMTRGAREVSVGFFTTCALTRTGQVKCWGVVPLAGGRTVSNVPLALPWYR
jgi:alpha-tubulin suppressor-like RCC1 family protein